MAELVSAYPTAGGIYWWASKLGSPVWGWFTGWFNLLGLIAILASVDYFAAQFLGIVLGLYDVNILGLNFGDSLHVLRETFVLFALILGAARLHQHPRQPPRRACSTASPCGGTSLGVAVIIGILIFVPDNHASFDFVFTEPHQQLGLQPGRCSGGTCCRSASC